MGDVERMLYSYEKERRLQAGFVGALAVSVNDEVGQVPYGRLAILRKVLPKLPNALKIIGVGYGYNSTAVYRSLRGDGSSSQLAALGPGDTRLCGEPGTRISHVQLQQPWPQEAVERRTLTSSPS